MKPEEAIGIFEAVKGLYKSPLLIEAMNTATKAIKELRKYQEIGTVEELKEIKNSLSLYKRYVDYLKKERDEVIEEIQQYRKIGTVEECREAVEKQKPKKPKDSLKINPVIDGNGAYVDADTTVYLLCPNCEELAGIEENFDNYCRECGQKIDKESEDE